MKPDEDQVEFTLIGPGYGECAVIHLGFGNWVVVDSCLDSRSRNRPAALAYLESIGMDPSECVKLIIGTHWHDDHIRGLGDLVKTCRSARFCCSAALTRPEFLAIANAYDTRNAIASGSGVREIRTVLEALGTASKSPIFASNNKRIFTLQDSVIGSGGNCSVWALSPSDKQFQKFLSEIAALMPCARETKARLVPQAPNHASVVTWIEIGETKLLLGADLEEVGNVQLGWSAIVMSSERPQGTAEVFKVPHHGSVNGHNDGVWVSMLLPSPFAILTPWNRSSKLPTPTDIKRIAGLSTNAYSASSLRMPKPTVRSPAVEKTLRERRIQIRPREPLTGAVRLRKSITNAACRWNLELMGNACPLSQVYV